MRHARPLAIFAALTVAWTWPLAAHPGDTIPGLPGDNYTFLWDLWWFRTAFDTPGLAYFRTNYLFYPFGIDMVGQSHVALPGLVAATLLRPLSIVAAHNAMVFAFVFLNMACAYALAWDLTRHERASIFAGIAFGLSPYLGAHFAGHFELMAAWTLPLFALLLRRGLDGSTAAVFGAALVAIVAAYTTYYYVIYIGLIAVVVIALRANPFAIGLVRRRDTPALHRSRVAILFTMAAVALLAAWIKVTGGRDLTASIGISMTQPQNSLSAFWVLGIVLALCTWRVTGDRHSASDATRRSRAVVTGAILGAVFLAGILPLAVEAARVVSRGEYVSQTYFWRSAPHGVDLAALVIGPPAHVLTRGPAQHLYRAISSDPIEAVGWIGVVLLTVLACVRGDRREREWWIVAAVFGLLALGPLLTVAGRDTGLWLPATLLRYVPIVSNARMPGRMIVVVFLALSAISALRIAGARGRWASPGIQWLLIGLLTFESWVSPIPVTHIDRPPVYEVLAQQPPGAVCEVPFGIGDGLGAGTGSQERSVLYYATIHRHPLVGGVVSRMPVDAADRYRRMAIAGDLLRLSEGRAAAAAPATEPSPCTYLIVRDAALSPGLRAFLDGLPREALASGDGRELFRLRDAGSGR